MRVVIIVVCTMLVILVISSCKTKQGLINAGDNSCEQSISQVSISDFNELNSDMYELVDAFQNGDHVNVRIKSNYTIAEGDLYWNGAVRKTYPAQASVNFILKGEETGASKETEYCFDITPLKSYGKIKLYFIDDEQTLSLEF